MVDENMGKTVSSIILLAIALCLLFIGTVSASNAACSTYPLLSIERANFTTAPGSINTVKISVTAKQDKGCGAQEYGVDFTNGYDAGQFLLAIKNQAGKNLFTLKPGETKTFEGVFGALPGTSAKNYTIQVTAYPESDHWKQASKNLNINVLPAKGNDAYWKTDVNIGWNTVPYANGIGVYGCPNITKAYRYSPSKQDYIELNRYGPLFLSSEKEMENEKMGALFVFSTERCSIESIIPAGTFSGTVSLGNGQLLSISPAWHNITISSLSSACLKQASKANDKVTISKWNADKQQWQESKLNDVMKNGDTLRISPNFNCTLDLEKSLG